QKLQSIHAVQKELEELRERVQNGIRRLEGHENDT
ncbi:MerR family transcriptional regulator, partial [Salmonella enterica]|nr:MerR family transcriptional regulator [Salmonella enterica]